MRNVENITRGRTLIKNIDWNKSQDGENLSPIEIFKNE